VSRSDDRNAASPSAATTDQRTAVVLCALPVEYQAMQAHLTEVRNEDHQAGTRFKVGQLANGHWRVALARTGPGNVDAAVLAERAISRFHPQVILCVGVAGALHDDLRLGDVVVAVRVHAYHGGTAAKDFHARPRTWDAPHRLVQLAYDLDPQVGQQAWLPPAPMLPPRVHFRPIATGEVVLNSRDSALFAQLRQHQNDAAAIEMEGAGIAQAAHLNGALDALVIRGISDAADEAKLAADRAGWQRRAAVNAAAFAAALLAELASSAPAAVSRAGQAAGEVPQPRGARQRAYIQQKTAGFVGRDFAFDEFSAFRDAHACGTMIVEGVPGTGKTSLLAEEARRRNWPAHFNIRAQGISGPDSFLRSLYEQLSERYQLRVAPPGAGDYADGRYLDRLLLATADLLQPREQLVIVVDALDEADVASPYHNPLFLPTALQAGIFLLVSRRSHTAPLKSDGPWTLVDLMAHRADSRRDAAAFIQASLARPAVAARLSGEADLDAIAADLLEHSQLNFMYLLYVLRDIEHGRMPAQGLRALPDGLTDYYERHLERMLARGAEADFSLRTIYTLAGLHEPVTASLLARALQVTELDVVRLLKDWAQFLEIARVRSTVTYCFYHQDFCDFLLQEETVRAAGVNLGEINSTRSRRLIAGLGVDLEE